MSDSMQTRSFRIIEIRSFRIADAIGKSEEKPSVVISWFFPELDEEIYSIRYRNLDIGNGQFSSQAIITVYNPLLNLRETLENRGWIVS